MRGINQLVALPLAPSTRKSVGTGVRQKRTQEKETFSFFLWLLFQESLCLQYVTRGSPSKTSTASTTRALGVSMCLGT